MKNRPEQHGAKPMTITRRRFITLSAFAVAAAAASPVTASVRELLPPVRTLSFYNIHTGESVEATYWVQGSYATGAMDEINHLLRDYRTGEIKAIDPSLLDLLHDVNRILQGSQAFHVVSGYRSPATNAMLAERSNGVAKHSLHLAGKAIDVYLPDRALKQLHRVALALDRGGVGYYPASGFVHLDVGPVRSW